MKFYLILIPLMKMLDLNLGVELVLLKLKTLTSLELMYLIT